MELARGIDNRPDPVLFESTAHALQRERRHTAPLDGRQPLDKRSPFHATTGKQGVQRRDAERQPRWLSTLDRASHLSTELAQGAKCLGTMFVSHHDATYFPAERRTATTFPRIRRSSSGPTTIGLKRGFSGRNSIAPSL